MGPTKEQADELRGMRSRLSEMADETGARMIVATGYATGGGHFSVHMADHPDDADKRVVEGHNHYTWTSGGIRCLHIVKGTP